MFELKSNKNHMGELFITTVTWANSSAHYYLHCTWCRSTLYRNSLLRPLTQVLSILQSSMQQAYLALERHWSWNIFFSLKKIFCLI